MKDNKQPVVIVYFDNDKSKLYAGNHLPIEMIDKIQIRIATKVNQIQKIISKIVGTMAGDNEGQVSG